MRVSEMQMLDGLLSTMTSCADELKTGFVWSRKLPISSFIPLSHFLNVLLSLRF